MLPLLFTLEDEPEESNIDFMARLFDEYQFILYHRAMKIVKNSEDAEDIIQDSFVSAMKKVKYLRSLKPEAQLAYLHTTVKNKSLNHINSSKRARAHLFEGDPESAIDQHSPGAPSPETLFLISEQRKQFSSICSELTSGERLLLEHKYIMRQSNAQIARAMGIKTTAVATRLMRLRRKVIWLLSNAEPGPKDGQPGAK